MEQAHELRCHTKLHAIVVGLDMVEIACRSRRCGWEAGRVILHRFEISTGKLLDTKEYKTIEVAKEEK